MTKAMMALEAEKAELARMVLDLDDMELVKKAKAALKRITTPKGDPSSRTRRTLSISDDL